MRISVRIYSFLALIAFTNTTFASINNLLPEAKLEKGTTATWNVGVGITQKLVHANLEWVNPYGIAYTKAGAFYNDDNEFGAQVGFRYPYHLTGKDKNGYYIGAYAGHIDSKVVNGEDKARLGGGVDFSYVMLSQERISTLSVGLGAGEKLKSKSGHVVADTEPKIQFSYTLSIGL